MAKTFGLGRGLDALIPRAIPSTDTPEIAIDRITRNPHQPRNRFDDEETAELAASIALHGVLQPIVVRAASDGGYELIAGERRLRAARIAGLSHIPAVVRETAVGESLELALVENVQRADLNAIEEATRLSRADRSLRPLARGGRRQGREEPRRGQQRTAPPRPRARDARGDRRRPHQRGTRPRAGRAHRGRAPARRAPGGDRPAPLRAADGGAGPSQARCREPAPGTPDLGRPGRPRGAAARPARHASGDRPHSARRPPRDRLLLGRGARSDLRHHHPRRRRRRCA